MKKFIALALGFALFLCPLLLFAQADEPLLDAPKNWITMALYILSPLLMFLSKKYKNLWNGKLTTIIGFVILGIGAVYGIVNVDKLSEIDLGALVIAAGTALKLFLSTDTPPKDSTSG